MLMQDPVAKTKLISFEKNFPKILKGNNEISISKQEGISLKKINYDILLYILFQKLYKLFLREHNLHQ